MDGLSAFCDLEENCQEIAAHSLVSVVYVRRSSRQLAQHTTLSTRARMLSSTDLKQKPPGSHAPARYGCSAAVGRRRRNRLWVAPAIGWGWGGIASRTPPVGARTPPVGRGWGRIGLGGGCRGLAIGGIGGS